MAEDEAPLVGVASEEEWDAAKPTASQTRSKWDPYLDVVAAGEIARRDFSDDQSKMAGARIGIGRRAKQRDMTVEFRSTGPVLMIRRKVGNETPAISPSDEGGSQQQPSTRGRKHKSTGAEQAPPSEEIADQVPVDESGEEG